jgi:hypothetical protein
LDFQNSDPVDNHNQTDRDLVNNNNIIFNKGQQMKTKLDNLKLKLFNKNNELMKTDGHHQLKNFINSYTSLSKES